MPMQLSNSLRSLFYLFAYLLCGFAGKLPPKSPLVSIQLLLLEESNKEFQLGFYP